MNQQQILSYSIAEIGAKFGVPLGHAYAEIITLEKQLTAHALTIQQMTANEATLVDHVQVLEAELAELKVTIETLMADLSPEAEGIASAGSAIIAEVAGSTDRKEKAASN